MPLPADLTPSIAELGKIKIGGLGEERTSKRGGKYRMPVKLDYFIIVDSQRDKDGRLVPQRDLMAGLVDTHGDADKKLRRIPIYLLSDEIDDVVMSQYVNYDGKRRVATCDGVTVTTYRPDGTTDTKPCTGEHKSPPWKLHTALACVIASGGARFGGFYKFRTTSIISAKQIYGGLLHIQSLTGGLLTGIPMELVVRPMQVSPDGKPTTVYVVHVELRGESLQAISEQATAAALYRAKNHARIAAAQRQYVALLQAPGASGEGDDEQAEVAAEFHPVQSPAPDPWDALTGDTINAEFTEQTREPGEEG